MHEEYSAGFFFFSSSYIVVIRRTMEKLMLPLRRTLKEHIWGDHDDVDDGFKKYFSFCTGIEDMQAYKLLRQLFPWSTERGKNTK